MSTIILEINGTYFVYCGNKNVLSMCTFVFGCVNFAHIVIFFKNLFVHIDKKTKKLYCIFTACLFQEATKFFKKRRICNEETSFNASGDVYGSFHE